MANELIMSGADLLRTMIDDWVGSDVDLYTYFSNIYPSRILPNSYYKTDAQLTYVELIKGGTA